LTRYEVLREESELRARAEENVRRRGEWIAEHTRPLARRPAEQPARAAAELGEARPDGAMRDRDEFIGVIAHELPGPVAALSLTAELLLRRRNEVSATFTPKLEVLSRQAKRLTALIRSLLDLTRIRTGLLQMHLQRERVDLGELVRKVVQDFADDVARP